MTGDTPPSHDLPVFVEPHRAGRAPSEQELLAGLNDSQLEAVTNPAPALCVLAGAGSGKTRVLTRRIAWRIGQESVSAEHVLALTFTRRAAQELRSRLVGMGLPRGVVAGTFHSVALAQLRRRWADEGVTPPGLADRKGRILGPLLGRADRAGVALGDAAAEIEWAKARMIGPDHYAEAARVHRRRPPLPAADMATLYARYEEDKRRRRLVDFDDLLRLAARAIESDPTFAASQRWRFRHLFVDEFQDVNPLQHRLLEAWRGGRDDICVVGDPNQAIYAWNGADASFIADFARLVPSSVQVRLLDNYRSSPQVLAVANAVLGDRADLRANVADGPVPTITQHSTDRAEAAAAVEVVRRARAGGARWSDVAVLTRTHAQLTLFEQAFGAADIPFRVRGTVEFLRQPEVISALATLRSWASDTALRTALADVEALVPPDPADGGDSPSEGSDQATERRARVQTLVRLAREHLDMSPEATVSGFLAWLSATLKGDDGTDPRADAVEGATMHAAKGLEWPVVILAGLEQGLVPIGHAESAAEKAEEKRLFYVGITRARRELHLCWAERRTFGSRTMSRTRSTFLEPVDAAISAILAGADPTEWRRYLAQGRTSLATGSGGRQPTLGANADPAVLESLKTWRSGVARAAGVPAYVVFHDTTLAAVAEARPTDTDGLLALPGVGPVKVRRYGPDLLALVARA